MLAIIAKGDTIESYIANVKRSIWKYRRTDNLPLGPEARALRELNTAGATIIVPQARSWWPRPVRLTERGEALLSEWNERFGPVAS
jgi:hypothetical protein